MSDDMPSEFAAKLRRFLIEHSLLDPDDRVTCTPLTGGVSSDIWRVDSSKRSLCVKRALPALRVAAQWQAPVSRNASEWAWLCFAYSQRPEAVPEPLAHDPHAGLFAMSYLPPEDFPVWKQMLLDGLTDPRIAAGVGDIVSAIHNASAGNAEIARRFDTLDTFTAIRLEPYLLATAHRHPALAKPLRQLVERTSQTRIALVHGDVSPKNILVGSRGPVLLDAECAWYGDPAFDLAFCLAHLLLKTLVHPDQMDAYLSNVEALAEAYLTGVQFESRAALEARAASLLPALLLARIDGKSPVEYLVDKHPQQQWVRNLTSALITKCPAQVADVAEYWRRRLPSLESAGTAHE